MAARLPFAVVFAVIGLLFAWGVASRAVGVDFPQFWFVGQSLSRPGLNIYSDDERTRLGAEFSDKAQQTGNARLIGIADYRQKFETYSSPFLYSSFRFISTGDYDVDLRNYHLLQIGCFVLSILVISRALQIPWDVTLLAMGLFCGWFSPFASDLRVGNVNSVQLLTLAVCIWATLRARWRYRDLLAGAIFGLSLAFKPNVTFVPALLAITWIFERNWFRLANLLIGAITGILVAILLSAVSFGSLQCWVDWINALRVMPSAIVSVEHGNFALAQILGGGGVTSLIVPMLFLGIAIVSIWQSGSTRCRVAFESRPTGEKPASEPFGGARSPAAERQPTGRAQSRLTSGSVLRRAEIAIALGCVLTVLAPGLVWLHYHVLVIPAFLIFVAALSGEASGRAAARQVLLSVALLGYCFETLGYVASPLPSLVQGITVAISSLILFVLILSLFGRSAPVSRSRSELA